MRYAQRRLLELGVPAGAPRVANLQIDKSTYHRDYARLRRQTVLGRIEVARNNLRATHSITLEQYDALYSAQQGRCAICSKQLVRSYSAENPTRRRGPVADGAQVDHDHACCPGRKTCGQCVRGLLCPKCNMGIGAFRDNAVLMQMAITYLQRTDRLLK